jgi:hypothetical protein
MLIGKTTAESMLQAWVSSAKNTFGNMPSNGDLLEWYVGRALDR